MAVLQHQQFGRLGKKAADAVARFLPRSAIVIGWNLAGPLKANAVDIRSPSSLTQVENRSDFSPPGSLGTVCSSMIFSANAFLCALREYSGVAPGPFLTAEAVCSACAKSCRCYRDGFQGGCAIAPNDGVSFRQTDDGSASPTESLRFCYPSYRSRHPGWQPSLFWKL